MKQAKPENKVIVIPPEGVPLSFDIATLSTRLSAVLFDMFLMMLFIVLLVILLWFSILSVYAESRGYLFSIFLIAVFLIRYGYFFYFELTWQGSTPGKRLMGIRVIARDGRALTIQGLIARNLLRDLEFFLPLGLAMSGFQMGAEQAWLGYLGFGWTLIVWLFVYFNPQHLRFGDLIGGTLVITIPRAVLRDDKARNTSVLRKTDIRFTPKQLSIYGEYELETLAAVLEKAEKHPETDLSPVAKAIAGKIHYEGSEPFSRPQEFLRVFYAAQRAALEQKLLWGKRKANKEEEP